MFSKRNLIVAMVGMAPIVMPINAELVKSPSFTLKDTMQRVQEKGRKFCSTLKKYAQDKRVRRYVIRGTLISVLIIGSLLMARYAYLPSAQGTQEIPFAHCKVIASDTNKLQVQVIQQIGGTCGYHAINNGACIAKAIITNNENVGHELMQQHDDLFISAAQPAYQKSHRGTWRTEIEDFRKKGLSFKEPVDDYLINWELLRITQLVEKDIPSQQDEYVIYVPADTSAVQVGRVIGTSGLPEHIEQFKKDTQKTVLPIVVNDNKTKHWFVDVLWKKNTHAITQVIADSFNWNQLHNPGVRTITEMLQNNEK